MSQKDVVSWTAMISSYGENGKYDKAQKLFSQMELAGVKEDMVTTTNILSICAWIADLDQRKYVHDYILQNRFNLHVFHLATLQSMVT